VGDRKYRWYAGRCLIFDDSFEHEVSHEGDTPRAVLITDFWHPDLTEAERWALGAMRESLRLASRYRRFVKKLQKAAGLRRGK
jgi:aspartate beta-hydroxylase